MSEVNIDVVRGIYAVWQDEMFRLTDEVWAALDPEIEWDASERKFDGEVFHGHDGIRQFVARLEDVWQSGSIDALEFIAAGDEVVVPVRLNFVSRTHGQTMTANAAHVWTLRDGRAVRYRLFQSKDEALQAAAD